MPEEMQKTDLAGHQRALLSILEEFDRICKKLDIPYILFAGTMLGAVRHKGFIPWDDDLDVLMLREDYNKFLENGEKELDNEKFFLQKEFSEHWPMFFSKLRLNGTACIEKYRPKDEKTHQGIYIDIFPCDSCAKTAFGRKLQFFASKVIIAKSLDKRGYETDSKKKKLFMALCRAVPQKPFLFAVKSGAKNSRLVHNFLGAASGFEKSVYPREYAKERVFMEFEGNEYPVSARYDEFLRVLYGDYMQIPPPEERKIKQHAVLVDTENSYENYLDFQKNMKIDVYTRSIR